MTESYRMRSAETWVRARDDYLAGLTAEAVCRRYDLGMSAFRKRARRYRWRRMDQDDPAPDSDDLWIYGDMSPEDQIRLAWLNFSRALIQGRALEARRWRRLWDELIVARDRLDADLCRGLSASEVAEMRLELGRDDADADDEETVRALSGAAAPAEKVHPVHSEKKAAPGRPQPAARRNSTRAAPQARASSRS